MLQPETIMSCLLLSAGARSFAGLRGIRVMLAAFAAERIPQKIKPI